jgi:hypothetical protein
MFITRANLAAAQHLSLKPLLRIKIFMSTDSKGICGDYPLFLLS